MNILFYLMLFDKEFAEQWLKLMGITTPLRVLIFALFGILVVAITFLTMWVF